MTGKISSVLVTGGAGFVGSHIVDRLTRDGRKVHVLDNLSTGKTENLAKQIRENSVVFAEGDVRDTSLAKELSSKTEAIVHLVTTQAKWRKLMKDARHLDVFRLYDIQRRVEHSSPIDHNT